ncbi:unnamed protein product, partial [Oppiella nova]
MIITDIFTAIVAILMMWSEVVVSDDLPTCRPQDFKYSFTECDGDGRWRVSVPIS